MELIPLYRLENYVLIGLKEDFLQSVVNDGLVVQLDIEKKKILHSPWSLQKKLKFGYFYPLNDIEKTDLLNKIQNLLDKTTINQIIDLFINPSKEAIESLIWIPERLRETK